MSLLIDLINNSGYIILIAFVLARLKSFKKIMQKDNYKIYDLIILSIVFGIFGIIGTYIGKEFDGAIANNRMIGIMTGGLLCGPFVGTNAAIIASAHRFFINPYSITTIPCSIMTIITGIISGYIYKKDIDKKKVWIHGFILSIIMESLEMILILIMSKPFSKALNIVKNIYVPMVVTNAIGAAISILLIQNIFKEKENIEAEQAKITLEIANKTLPYFRELNSESLEKVCNIIKDYINADAVAITDKDHILVHVGYGSNHHIVGKPILTKSTKEVIENGQVKILTNKSQIGCTCDSCELKSAIIAPIKDQDEIIGTFKIYYIKENAITFKNKALVLGLSNIISTQLEISKISKLKEMANEAEIKALQSQINPHFLFNVLNTIASFIHIDPEKARELLVDFSNYLRYNLENNKTFVEVNKEIEHIKCYIKIEKARFGDKLNVIYEIDDNIDIKIPNLIIEPLVENSVKHGILKGNIKGTIEVKVKKINKDKIKIVVQDNGIGIDEEIIRMVNEGEGVQKNIGLLNVNNRLKSLYGNSLIIERLNKGTRISFYVNRI